MQDGKSINHTLSGQPGKYYSTVFTLACSCGNRQWSLLGETMSCPKCGRMVEKEGEQGVSKEVHI